MRFILTILLSFLFIESYEQDIKKGFKLIEKKEYGRALESFKKDLQSNPDNVGANLGMALVLADDSSGYFNVLDAWQYVEKIQNRINELSQTDIDILTAYFLNTEVRKTSRPVKKKIEIAIEAIEGRFIKYIREENNLDAVYEALERYPDFRHHDNIIHIRNQFEYRKYEKMNTIEGYEEFMKKFPDAAQITKAVKSRNKIAFEEIKKQNTVGAYMSYIVKYPESEYLQQVIILRNAAAFAEAKKINTFESYQKFMEQYPDALEVSEARAFQQDILYEQSKKINSLEAFNRFIKAYPDGKYFVDIFNLKAAELGGRYLRENNFTSPSILWARGYDNNGKIESGGSICSLPDGNYILACNTHEHDTAYTDAWILKIDMNGKILWNKTIGQPFNDVVNHILIDSRGDLIFIGYTQLIADSASEMGWMFKLGSDGRKIWNKNLGKIEINGCAIDSDDRILIAGSSTDTLGVHYAITIFNNDAQHVGERVYSSVGEFNDILVDNGIIYAFGSNWICSLDDRFYLRWDAAIDALNSVDLGTVAADKSCFVTGSGNGKMLYARYDATGKKSWYQSYDKTDTMQVVKAVASLSGNNLAVLEQKSEGGKMKIFSSSGNILKVKDFYGSLNLEAILPEGQGTMLLMNNGDLFLVKYTDINEL